MTCEKWRRRPVGLKKSRANSTGKESLDAGATPRMTQMGYAKWPVGAMEVPTGARMNLNDETFDWLISQIFSAALDNSQWQVFLDTLGAVSGGVRTHILGHDLRLDFSLPAAFSGYGKEHIDSWNAHFGFHNAWAPGFSEASVGQTISTEAMCATDVLHRTEFYNDWVRPQEDISSGGGVVLAKNETSFFALGGNIRARDHDTLQALLQRLTPHLQNALAISRRIGGLQIENAALARAGVGADGAVLVLDGAGRLIHANAAAQTRLARGTILRSDMRGRVGFADAAANRRLAEALAGWAGPAATFLRRSGCRRTGRGLISSAVWRASICRTWCCTGRSPCRAA